MINKILVVKFLAVFLGLTVGNFVWEAFTTQNWSRASDHTYFEAIALIAMFLVLSVFDILESAKYPEEN